MNKKEINEKNRKIWDKNAKVWNETMGEKGNRWHLELVAPSTLQLLDLQTKDHILDIGCGNGIFSRRLNESGVKVTAFDFSEENIKYAKSFIDEISYKRLDITKKEDLNQINANFNKAVANMVFMDVPEIETLFSFLSEKMKRGDVFVFSIQHPAFNSEFVKFNESSISISNYALNSMSMGVAIEHQPEKQFYFHRPISYYSKISKENGFVIDLIDEPLLDGDELFSKIPPIMIFKLLKN